MTILHQKKFDVGGERLYSPEEVGEMINVRPQTLAIWRMKGINLSYIKAGRRVLYSIDDINDFLLRCRREIVK